MVPSESGSGQLFQHDSYLCDLLYEIDYPLGFANIFRVLRLKFVVQNHDPAALVEAANLALVTGDGTVYQLSEPLEMQADGALQCTVNLSS